MANGVMPTAGVVAALRDTYGQNHNPDYGVTWWGNRIAQGAAIVAHEIAANLCMSAHERREFFAACGIPDSEVVAW